MFSQFKDADLDALVLQYLQRKGYNGAVNAFKRDSHIAADTNDTEQSKGKKSVTIENLLHIAQAENDVERYISGYQRLWTWIDGCLDMYRGELKRILYPVFLHAYIDLIRLSRTQLAANLMNRHKKQLVDNAPPTSSHHRENELRDLQSVAVPQHLETNPRAKSLKNKKHRIRMCSPAYHLLLNFLQSSRLWPILNIINQNLEIEVYSGEPQGNDQAYAEGEEEEEAVDPAIVALNRTEIDLQLLKGNLEDKLWELVHPEGEDKGEGPKEGGKEGEGGPKTKKQKSEDKQKQNQRRQHDREVEKRREPKLKLPELSEEQQKAALKEMRGRQEVGPSHPPSCCFFTFCNTRQSLTCAAHAQDATFLAGGFSDATIRLYSVEAMSSPSDPPSPSGQAPGQEPQDDGRMRRRDQVTLFGHTAPVNAVDFTADSQLLLSGSTDGTVRMWSTELAANLVVWDQHRLPVWDVAACPSGYFLASCSADRTAHLWCTEHRAPLRVFTGHDADVDVVRWHPNCHYIATGSTDKTVRLWDVQTGECVRVMQGHGAPLSTLAFSPDGSSLASASTDGAIMIWDLGSARRMATLLAHDGPVWTLGYSHGRGSVLASGGADCTLKLWSPHGNVSGSAVEALERPASVRGLDAAWNLLGSYRTKSTPVYSLQFSTRNLLLGTGALCIRSNKRSRS